MTERSGKKEESGRHEDPSCSFPMERALTGWTSYRTVSVNDAHRCG